MKIRISWLDLKLGARMLIKYPGLTLVGGLSMAFAVAVGAVAFEWLNQLVHPRLPLDEGDRIVGIRLWDASTSMIEQRAVHDFVKWREEVRSVNDLGAFQTIELNLVIGKGQAEPIQVTEMSASGFRVARVPPLLGRSLVEADEEPGAPPVAVLGYNVWQRRFASNPGIVGQQIRVGDAMHTVVGVMPKDFAFPVSNNFWVPFRPNPLAHPLREGPVIRIFGRLAPGATIEEAQAELTTLGRRMAADFPETHRHLRPEVMPYGNAIMDVPESVSFGLLSINGLFMLLLVLICANVALLVFVRTAARESEIVVRNALGASRNRIVGQLFAEALVLGGAGALIGLTVTALGLPWGFRMFESMEGRLPFWFSASLSPSTVFYAVALTVLGALIVGAVPALKVTERGLDSRLRQAAAGVTTLRVGWIWNAVIVLQLAVTAVTVPITYVIGSEALRKRAVQVGFPSEEYLSVFLEMDRETPRGASAETAQAEFLARYRKAYEELGQALEAEPGVTAVTFADRLPRMAHPQLWIEVEGEAAARDSVSRHRVSSASVAEDYFDVLGAPILSGRGFHSGDLNSEQRPVIVNRTFVDRVLAGRNPIGRRIRYAGAQGEAPAPWYEIVGVVRDLGMIAADLQDGAGVYRPLGADAVYPVYTAVHVGQNPRQFAPRLRSLAATVDPGLRLNDIMPLDEAGRAVILELTYSAAATAVVALLALLLSVTGIYSVMSFTVSRRTREIGIRCALGASRQRIIAPILLRVFGQIGLGILLGAAIIVALDEIKAAGLLGLVAAHGVLMLGVCTLACIVPIRRALRIEPTEALRAGM